MSLYAAEKWEAPDRNYRGHRDGLTRNLSRYRFAVAQGARGRGLDIGCGRGYGFDFLRGPCAPCDGLDVAAPLIEEARANYPDVTFTAQSAEALPYPDGVFDTITSFEVIEHVQDDHAFLREIRRVAAPGALVCLSTPNRLVASGGREKPLNRFHVREYLGEEFRALLAGTFGQVAIYGQTDSPPGRPSQPGLGSRLINLLPVRLKYLLPHYVQDYFSVLLRPPLRLEDCTFTPDLFEGSHSFLAVCRV
jgi:SAM-dependent methyltransferase